MNSSVVFYGGSMSDKDPSDARPPHPLTPGCWHTTTAHIRQAAAVDSSEPHGGLGQHRMCPASPKMSGFPTLLLFLLLLRPGLQAPTRPHWNTTLCNETIKELKTSFQNVEKTNNILDQVPLCRESLARKNLCAFLTAMERFPNVTDKMKKNLEFLKEHVPEPRDPPTGDPITISDWNDFQKKLKYYLQRISCEESKPTQSTSTSPQKCGFVPVFSPVSWQC